MARNKKLKDYFNLGMRKLKHRKGFGVHSPFAFAIITEVIEEKLPYYAYRTMQSIYTKQAPTSYKVACLLHRLTNRFQCRTIVQVACDGGFTMLPILLADSRNRLITVASEELQAETEKRMDLLHVKREQYGFLRDLSMLEENKKYDMIVINDNPFNQNDAEAAAEELVEWTLNHMHEETLIFVKGIKPRQSMELFWDRLCDRDEISITMDLYDHGLGVVKQNFFKQHYIVAF